MMNAYRFLMSIHLLLFFFKLSLARVQPPKSYLLCLKKKNCYSFYFGDCDVRLWHLSSLTMD